MIDSNVVILNRIYTWHFHKLIHELFLLRGSHFLSSYNLIRFAKCKLKQAQGSSLSNCYYLRSTVQGRSQLIDPVLWSQDYLGAHLWWFTNFDITPLKTMLSDTFNIKDLSPLKSFLGLETIIYANDILAPQRKYTCWPQRSHYDLLQTS